MPLQNVLRELDAGGSPIRVFNDGAGNLWQGVVIANAAQTGIIEPATEGTLAAVLAALDDPATETTLASILSGQASLATETTLSAILGRLPAALGQAASADSFAVVLPSDQVVAISAASLPLPAGAAAEATLLGRATEATLAALSGQIPPALGQAPSAGSLAVVLASDQSDVPITVASLPLPAGAATEATLGTRASETTAAAILAALGPLATETTLAALLTTAATETTAGLSLSELVGIANLLAGTLSTKPVGVDEVVHFTPAKIPFDNATLAAGGWVTLLNPAGNQIGEYELWSTLNAEIEISFDDGVTADKGLPDGGSMHQVLSERGKIETGITKVRIAPGEDPPTRGKIWFNAERA